LRSSQRGQICIGNNSLIKNSYCIVAHYAGESRNPLKRLDAGSKSGMTYFDMFTCQSNSVQ
jgi:hypothetical protein